MRGRYLHNVQDGHVKPYRAQVNDFNTYLSNPSEHNDIPQVSKGVQSFRLWSHSRPC